MKKKKTLFILKIKKKSKEKKIIKLIISLLKNVIISIFQYVCVSLPILLCGFYILLILNPCKAEIMLHEIL